MTYQQTTAVVDLAVETALVSLSFYFFSSAVAVLTMVVAAASLAETTAAVSVAETALVSLSFYFFSSAVAVPMTVLAVAAALAVDVAANYLFAAFPSIPNHKGDLSGPLILCKLFRIRNQLAKPDYWDVSCPS